jgi:hypothetical protein
MTFIKKAGLSLSIAVFATSTAFADPVATGAGSNSNSGGDDDNTVAIVAGLGLLAGAGYLYATGAFSGGFAGTAAAGTTSSAAKMGKTAVKATAQQPQRSVKRNANTHTHPAVPGVTKSMAHTHMGPMPHSHRYGK